METAKKYFQFSSTFFFSIRNFLNANGNIITKADAHRKKFKLMGGILPEIPRAITKFTDQMTTEIIAKLTPMYKFFFPGACMG